MILTGKEDLRVVKTIEGIKTAFEQLICEKDYEKITVKELCERARINKKTFYHYYETLDFLLAELQMELSSGYVERVKNFKLPEELDKVNREFFLFSAEQGLAYEKITISVSYGTIRQEMIDEVFANTWGKSKQFQSLTPLQQKAFLSMLPLTLEMSRYADREYFAAIGDLPENGQAIDDFENGDLTYYTAGKSLAIFFGNADNSSQSDLIRMGKITSDLSLFDEIGDNVTVTIAVAESEETKMAYSHLC